MEDKDYKDLGLRVRRQRLQLGWTQEHLARELGVSTSFVGHIERGSRKASIETLVAIAKCMNISTDYLLASSLERENVPAHPRPAPNDGQRARLNGLLNDLQHCLEHWGDAESNEKK